jgi:hypothetical protein
MSDEVFSLCLSTSTSQSNNLNIPIYRTAGNLADVSWLVNYDEIFGDKIKEYNFCRVRFNLAQGSATYSWNSQIGYLAANFQSDFNAPTTCMPTILGIIYAQQNQNTQFSDQVYTVSTLNECGVDININSLIGRQILQLKFCNDDSNTPMSNIANDWEIALFFQLYN